MLSAAVLKGAQSAPEPSILARLLHNRFPLPAPAPPSYERIPITLIQECAAHAAGMSTERLLAARRDEPRARARQIAMYLCTELTSCPLPFVAKAFRKRDHTTVSYARDKVKERMSKNPTFAAEVATLRTLIQGIHRDLREVVDTDPNALVLLTKI